VLQKLVHKIFSKLLLYFLEKFEKNTTKFVTKHTRPMYSNDIGIISPYKVKESISIVMQGEVLEENNFTYETIKLYKRMFPHCLIILSTWEGEHLDTIDKIINLDVQVILNQKPTVSDGTNVNMQTVSSVSGIELALKLNSDFCLKTRTDHRIYNPDIFANMLSLQRLFPSIVQNQNDRLVFFSLGTIKYRLYSISDMFVFGRTNEILKYFDVELKEVFNENSRKILSINKWSKSRFSEVYLFTEYLKKYHKDIKWSLSDYWRFCRDFLIIIDEKSIDIFWHKYDRHNEYRRKNYEYAKNNIEISFLDWVSFDYMKVDLDEKCIQNTIINKSISSYIKNKQNV
jgi:hypothetical protein